MKKFRILTFVLISICFAPLIASWGTYGHERINHAAVLSLPDPLRSFFYKHIDFITEEATVPDLRKYTLQDKSEYPRHYIDMDVYGSFDTLPSSLKDARKKYSEEHLSKNGILYWYLHEMMEKLTKAFREKRKTEILFLAGDLGHYIGDAHVPLHTTSNHDGQLTGQKGIHAFWESQLPELFGDTYSYNVGEGKYLENIDNEIKKNLNKSFQLSDTVLRMEKRLSEIAVPASVYEKDEKGEIRKNKFNQPVHNLRYSQLYHAALDGMVEKQMRSAIFYTASFWYTAWVNAGRPDLSESGSALDPLDKEKLQKELTLLKEGKLIPFFSEKEF